MTVQTYYRVVFVLSALALLLAACVGTAEVVQPSAVAKVASTKPVVAETAVSSATVVPTENRAPTNTPAPTHTTEPTHTAVPTATLTAESTPIATAESPLTLRINADGSGDLPTLEEAIAFAAAGSTIELSAGEYELEETLNIDKPLAIGGAGAGQTTLHSDAPSAAINYDGEGLLALNGLTVAHGGSFAADIISVRSGEVDLADCRLEGALLSTRGDFGAGLFILNDAAVKANGCEIVDNSGAGVVVIHEADITLEDSKVSGNGAGILFDGSSSGQVARSTIEGNDEAGILVFALARPDIADNLIQDNIGYGIRYQLDDNVGGIVLGNELLNNNVAGQGATGTDIVIFDAFAPHLNGNTCRGGEGLALASGGLGVAADPSGIIFFNTAVGQAQDIVPDDNDCALAFCSLSPGTADFELQCNNQ